MLKSYETVHNNGQFRISPSSHVDLDLKEMWQEWKNQNGGKKPQGGKLRPKLQGKTAAQCVLDDRF